MSILSSLKKRSTLDAAIKQVAKARKSQGGQAEQLYKGAYQGFANVIADHLMISEALYHWGFALLHEAKTQETEQAVETLEDAITKFSFCLLISKNYLGAAIDGGVAFMELARISPDDSKDYLYKMAQQFFEKALDIQKGTASYNLACIFALREDDEACLAALRNAKEHGSLPEEDMILGDPDMSNVIDKPWLKEFLRELRVKPEAEARKKDDEAINYEPKINFKKMEEFDYYASEKRGKKTDNQDEQVGEQKPQPAGEAEIANQPSEPVSAAASESEDEAKPAAADPASGDAEVKPAEEK